MAVVSGQWQDRAGRMIRMAAYSKGEYIEYNSQLHKFYFIWPFPEFIDGQEQVVAYPTSYMFRARAKKLKESGYHNCGPVVDKKCFLFTKKVNTDSGQSTNSPIKIAINFSGEYFLWIDKGHDQAQTETQFDLLLNLIETVI